MIKRPLNPRFSEAVLAGHKTTTIRPNPWPIDKPIMLYNWAGKPYRSKQVDVTPVIVLKVTPIRIERMDPPDITFNGAGKDGRRPSGMRYSIHRRDGHEWGPAPGPWREEGFESQADMDDWFMQLVKPGQHIDQHIMEIRLFSK